MGFGVAIRLHIGVGIGYAIDSLLAHQSCGEHQYGAVASSRKTIVFGWWPISIFAGWIAVATIANISAYLSKLGWEGGPLSATNWTIVMIVIATLLNIVLIFTRGMREFALVGVWALFAIYVRHQNSYDTIATTALVGAVVIFVSIFSHAFKNRKINPFYGKYFK